MRRYVIIGTGAVGGAIGGNLARFGVPVVWVARGEHGAALRERGMTLHTPDGTHHPTAPVWSGPGEAELTRDDVLLLCVKTQSAAAAAAEWADVELADGGGFAGQALPLLCCTNGTAAEDLVARYFARVFGVCVWCPSTFVTPGEIAVRFGPANASLHVGRVPASAATDADRALASEIERDFTASNLEVYLPGDVLPWKRRKLVTNMGNVVDALLGPGADKGVKRSVIRALEGEAYAVMDAARAEVTPDDEEAALRASGPKIQKVTGHDSSTMGNSSTWQSLAKGGDLETDYLNGEIVRLAHLAGVDAPRNAAVCRLARAAVREGRRPGDLDAHELARIVGVDQT